MQIPIIICFQTLSGRRRILFHLPDSLGPCLANDHCGDAFHLQRVGVRQVGWWSLAGTGSALCSLHCGLLVYHSASVIELRTQRLACRWINWFMESCCVLKVCVNCMSYSVHSIGWAKLFDCTRSLAEKVCRVDNLFAMASDSTQWVSKFSCFAVICCRFQRC